MRYTYILANVLDWHGSNERLVQLSVLKNVLFFVFSYAIFFRLRFIHCQIFLSIYFSFVLALFWTFAW